MPSWSRTLSRGPLVRVRGRDGEQPISTPAVLRARRGPVELTSTGWRDSFFKDGAGSREVDGRLAVRRTENFPLKRSSAKAFLVNPRRRAKMSFFDWPVEPTEPTSGSHPAQFAIASTLTRRFSAIFPQVQYKLLWRSRIINAQAWRLGEIRNVYLYGGLVRFPEMSEAGLALTLAHETGHHLGGGPRHPWMSWMTTEEGADCWAATVGMPTVFGRDALALTAQGAREISYLRHRVLNGGP